MNKVVVVVVVGVEKINVLLLFSLFMLFNNVAIAVVVFLFVCYISL